MTTPTILSRVKMTRSLDCAIASLAQDNRVFPVRIELKYERTINGRLRAGKVAGGRCRPRKILT